MTPPPRRHLDYLRDILAMMNKIGSFTADLDFDRFVQDDKTYMATIRAIEVIGEATKNVPAAVRKQYPHIPWKKMAGMRDKLIHAYFGADATIVWETATALVPELKVQIAQVLEAELRRCRREG